MYFTLRMSFKERCHWPGGPRERSQGSSRHTCASLCAKSHGGGNSFRMSYLHKIIAPGNLQILFTPTDEEKDRIEAFHMVSGPDTHAPSSP